MAALNCNERESVILSSLIYSYIFRAILPHSSSSYSPSLLPEDTLYTHAYIHTHTQAHLHTYEHSPLTHIFPPHPCPHTHNNTHTGQLHPDGLILGTGSAGGILKVWDIRYDIHTFSTKYKLFTCMV